MRGTSVSYRTRANIQEAQARLRRAVLGRHARSGDMRHATHALGRPGATQHDTRQERGLGAFIDYPQLTVLLWDRQEVRPALLRYGRLLILLS